MASEAEGKPGAFEKEGEGLEAKWRKYLKASSTVSNAADKTSAMRTEKVDFSITK